MANDESINYVTAFSHLCVGGCSLYYLLYEDLKSAQWTSESYKIFVVYSLVGLWKWGTNIQPDIASAAYHHVVTMQKILTLPLIGMDMWISNGHREEIGWAHLGICLLPQTAFYANLGRVDELTHLVVGINAVSIATVSLLVENYWGLATAIHYALTHFCIGTEGEIMSMPAIQYYNFALCAFTQFCFKACLHNAVLLVIT